jgi:allantoate deiminase
MSSHDSPSPVGEGAGVGSARQVMRRCDILGGFSEEPDRLTRRFATEPMRRANEAVAGWMRAAGMSVHQDAIGNLVGRFAASAEASAPDAKTLLLGSHLDSVRDAGKYDGPLGVLVALAAIERQATRGERLPYAVELYAFADEEGLRYKAYLGSSVVAGSFDPALLARADADGIPMAEAIRTFGGDPDRLAESARRRDDLLGYVEVHIEQGPVLEQQGFPVGVVSAIQGQSRIAVTFTGEAGHAGTVPVALRHDALCAASELVLAVEAYARNQQGAVATVGQMDVAPGASNVIPGRVALSLDVRHPDDAVREDLCGALERSAREIAASRGITLDWRLLQANPAVACSQRLSTLLSQAVASAGHEPLALPSGAGHDGVVISAMTEIAMLFVRCRQGISHSPLESVDETDVAVAIDVLERFMGLLASELQKGGKR